MILVDLEIWLRLKWFPEKKNKCYTSSMYPFSQARVQVLSDPSTTYSFDGSYAPSPVGDVPVFGWYAQPHLRPPASSSFFPFIKHVTKKDDACLPAGSVGSGLLSTICSQLNDAVDAVADSETVIAPKANTEEWSLISAHIPVIFDLCLKPLTYPVWALESRLS